MSITGPLPRSTRRIRRSPDPAPPTGAGAPGAGGPSPGPRRASAPDVDRDILSPRSISPDPQQVRTRSADRRCAPLGDPSCPAIDSPDPSRLRGPARARRAEVSPFPGPRRSIWHLRGIGAHCLRGRTRPCRRSSAPIDLRRLQCPREGGKNPIRGGNIRAPSTASMRWRVLLRTFLRTSQFRLRDTVSKRCGFSPDFP